MDSSPDLPTVVIFTTGHFVFYLTGHYSQRIVWFLLGKLSL